MQPVFKTDFNYKIRNYKKNAYNFKLIDKFLQILKRQSDFLDKLFL